MKSFNTALLLAFALPLLCGAQELRLRGVPEIPSPSEYWETLAPLEMKLVEKKEQRVTPAEVPAWQTRYTLGAGDALNFSVYDRADLARENVQIGPDGTVSYLQAVAIRAQGLTLDQLRTRIEEELSKYQKNVKVIITPSGITSKNFSIIGRVKKPGSFTLDRPTSVLEAIALAEGIQIGSVRGSAFELADFERSFVARKGKKLNVDLARLYYEGDFNQNAYLEPDDYIYVASSLDNEIYVLGEIRDPGRRKMPVKLTLAQAIAESGGFTDVAYQIHVLLIRGSIHEPVTQVVNVKDILNGKIKDIPLQNKDIIFISKRPFELAERVLDTAIFTFMQTVTTEAMNQAYNPIVPTIPTIPAVNN
ncbi:MAG: polysaccharide biosynthesis/export family protein [Verrucomicrobiales bacterium]|jgi:protein involved in polysaccharide export with SLBB domain|nr:polysaccharide biosynthesis/export family protein [Verrucomicrobiales bacterium]